MNNRKAQCELEQIIADLKDLLRKEKHRHAEEVFGIQLVYSAIILIMLFFVLLPVIQVTGILIQWILILVYLGVAALVFAFISKRRWENSDLDF